MNISASGLVQNARELIHPHTESALRAAHPLTAEAVFLAASQQDAVAQKAAGRLLEDLINGLNSFIYLYAPDRIVLNGGLSPGLRPYLPGLMPHLAARPIPWLTFDLLISELQEDAGLLGSAAQWSPVP
jgi:predicted NBD/HSP70 family sugar kinase